MRPNPKPQEIYRHFKGNRYQVITLARNSEDGTQVVVYQQLYEPYEVYVRPLEMFMSRVDTEKYPNERQIYRFEKLDIERVDFKESDLKKSNIEDRENTRLFQAEQAKASDRVKTASAEPQDAVGEEGFELDAGLVEFLDANSYEKKLQILSSLHPRITDAMIDTMAVSLDTEVKAGDIETRYNEIKNCLLTMERFECNRLRT